MSQPCEEGIEIRCNRLQIEVDFNYDPLLVLSTWFSNWIHESGFELAHMPSELQIQNFLLGSFHYDEAG